MQKRTLEMIDQLSRVVGADSSTALQALWSLSVGGEPPPIGPSTELLQRRRLRDSGLERIGKSLMSSAVEPTKETSSTPNLRSEGDERIKGIGGLDEEK